jgi:hypothetical protein
MYLGTPLYPKIKDIEPVFSIFFYFPFMMVYRFVFMNTFLAILYRNLSIQLDKLQQEQEEEEEDKKQHKKKGYFDITKQRIRRLIKSVFHKEDVEEVYESDEDEEENPSGSAVAKKESDTVLAAANYSDDEDEADDMATEQRQQVLAAAAALLSCNDTFDGRHLEDEEDREQFLKEVEQAKMLLRDPACLEEVVDQVVMHERVKQENWHFLPDNMQEWAIKRARQIYRQLILEVLERAKVADASEIDKRLEEAETMYREHMKLAKKEAVEVQEELFVVELSKLREVHRDQESLAWYIMRQEAEKERLVQQRDGKRSGIEKMMAAAQVLVEQDAAYAGEYGIQKGSGQVCWNDKPFWSAQGIDTQDLDPLSMEEPPPLAAPDEQPERAKGSASGSKDI